VSPGARHRLSERRVSYEEPFAELPPEVLELARAGNKMEAAKRYRELTGADGKEAMEAVGRI
jgi:ribosomal protein L7/L12